VRIFRLFGLHDLYCRNPSIWEATSEYGYMFDRWKAVNSTHVSTSLENAANILKCRDYQSLEPHI
jgi:hypothetical protein